MGCQVFKVVETAQVGMVVVVVKELKLVKELMVVVMRKQKCQVSPRRCRCTSVRRSRPVGGGGQVSITNVPLLSPFLGHKLGNFTLLS